MDLREAVESFVKHTLSQVVEPHEFRDIWENRHKDPERFMRMLEQVQQLAKAMEAKKWRKSHPLSVVKPLKCGENDEACGKTMGFRPPRVTTDC